MDRTPPPPTPAGPLQVGTVPRVTLVVARQSPLPPTPDCVASRQAILNDGNPLHGAPNGIGHLGANATATQRQAFAAFAGAIAERYSSSNTVLWELINERKCSLLRVSLEGSKQPLRSEHRGRVHRGSPLCSRRLSRGESDPRRRGTGRSAGRCKHRLSLGAGAARTRTGGCC